jgi:transposase
METDLQSSCEEIDYEVRIVRKRQHRCYYKRTCGCTGTPSLISAPAPLRALPKSKYSDNFWIETLLFKYDYQFPTERLIRLLDSHGLHKVAAGTLCGGIERCSHLLRPLYDEIVRHNKSKLLRCMDETGMKVFVDRKGRSSHTWWLWQSSTNQTCVFFLDRTRSYSAPSEYLKETPTDGVICADRYKVYQKLNQKIAFCWAHVRRDFVRIGRGQPQSLNWAVRWLSRIKKLYRLNRKRVSNKDKPQILAIHQQKLVEAINEIKNACDIELASSNWWHNESRRKVLRSMKNHWEGLTLFLTDPAIPLDNNSAERQFRPVANFRKNCFGVHSEKFGHITAMILSIFATLKLNDINIRAFLQEYLQAIAKNPNAIDSTATEFLPWNLSSVSPQPHRE